VYGVTTLEHPAVQMISLERGKYYLGGKLQVSRCSWSCQLAAMTRTTTTSPGSHLYLSVVVYGHVDIAVPHLHLLRVCHRLTVTDVSVRC
jgi:hypothetical protein